MIGAYLVSRGQRSTLGERGSAMDTLIYQTQQSTQMAKKLYVGNLAWATTSDSLKDAFSQAGEVISATVMTDKMTGRSRGFGFVEVPDEVAEAAISMWNEKDLDGRAIIVNEARPMTDRPAGDRPRRDFGDRNDRGPRRSY